jgi:large subunit ribosomal protein L20
MRISSSKTRRRSNKRLFREAKGNYSGRHRLIRTVQETVIRGRAYAYRDRRAKKRDFRQLWIARLSAACALRGLRYSTFIHGLKLANIELNRKMLSELAIHEPAVFDEIVAQSQAALG